MTQDRRITVWLQRFADREALQLQWVDPVTGKRKTRSAKTNDLKIAEKKRGDLEYELNHGFHLPGEAISWNRFREILEREFLPGHRPNTRKKYQRALDLLEEVSRPERLNSVSARLLSQFLTSLRSRPCRGRVGMAPKTIFVYLTLLHAALSWAVGQQLLAEVPQFPIVKVPKRVPRGVAAEHWERLFDRTGTDQQMRAYLLCAWRAGLRLNEALALERDETDEAPWLDLARDRIVFPAAIVKAAEDQTVPLDAELRKALLALPRHGRKVFRFLGRYGQPVTFSAVSKRVGELARQAGVRLSYHVLRRGFCSYYAARVPAAVLTRLTRNTLPVAMAYYIDISGAVDEAVKQRNREDAEKNSVESTTFAT